MGHRHGDGPEMNEAVGFTAQQVGRVWSAVQYREKKFNEDWLVIVTTDHGRDSINGKGHGGQSARERTTWIATDAKDLNHYWRGYNPAHVDIIPTIAPHLGVVLARGSPAGVDGVPLEGK